MISVPKETFGTISAKLLYFFQVLFNGVDAMHLLQNAVGACLDGEMHKLAS